MYATTHFTPAGVVGTVVGTSCRATDRHIEQRPILLPESSDTTLGEPVR